MLQRIKQDWFSNIRADVLAGITTVLALIPDSLAFAFIAGVNPMISIISSISILVLISIFGGRPAMVSTTAGSMAVLMTALVATHGVEYLFAATILTGIIQYLMGRFKMGRWMSFVPHSVITGFINSLAILIFISQLRYFENQSWGMYAMVIGTLVMIYVIPKFFKAIPSPLLAVVAMTLLVVFVPGSLQTVGDIAAIDTSSVNWFHIPMVPFTFETLIIILPVALSLAVVGYSETLLTQTIIDEMTDTKSDKDKEMRGQGIANTVTGFVGGMAGCALIAESAINVKVGGRGRLSTLVAAVMLLLMVFVLDDLLNIIPIAALVGVMMMVCIEVFDWSYIRHIRSKPFAHTFIMVVTVIVMVTTHNLALGVIVGVLMSVIVYAYRSASHLDIEKETNDNLSVYRVKGQLFFVSSNALLDSIDFTDEANKVQLDLSSAHVWDHTAKQTLDKIVTRLSEKGKEVEVVSPRKQSA
ncbi:SulP family inorganic anion transporter [Paenibacillus camelliae]|uniref:SulP family inorganic anion transporter n=1 Tax=Paenibacillus camelliae TaxID=512410 RepID=UPI00203B46EC|nr:SulP family inorganic anion transporter [Paenibacillus camelliae]MCM3634110.1 SulP family inorganic anion transporter [Paenibacillus camelliae]